MRKPSDSNDDRGRLGPLYFRLSGFYFFYFALLGGMAPFWSVFLESKGFSALEIGQLMSILMLTKLIAPNLWAYVGDRTGHRLLLMRWGCFLAFVIFAGFLMQTEFWWFVSVMALFSFFWNAVLPQFEVITLNNLGHQRSRYSQIRLWGSIGFIASVQLLGAVFDYLSIEWLPYILGVLLLLIWLAGMQPFNGASGVTAHKKGALRGVLKERSVIAFLGISFLLQLGHGPYYTFYSLYLEQHHYSRLIIGTLWAVGVWAEVILFVFMPKLLERFSMRSITLTALLLTAFRWIVIARLPDNLLILFLAQLLHAASFGAMHAVAMHFIHDRFYGRAEGQGQALYASVSFGGGGFLGALAGGYFADLYGMASSFLFSALVTIGALILGMLHYRPDESCTRVKH